MTEIQTGIAHPTPDEFRPLQTLDEYSRYFNQLRRVFEKLLEVFQIKAGRHTVRVGEKASPKGNNYETRTVTEFLSKLLFTTDAFRIKYTYNPDHTLKVDLTDSGFPGFMEISSIRTDLLNRESRLEHLPTLAGLKQEMLDHMFKKQTDPEKLLSAVSERAYYEMLEPDKFFLSFVFGDNIQLNTDSRGEQGSGFNEDPESWGLDRKDINWRNGGKKFRNYTCSWGCYDFSSNRPYIHLMIFDQDADSVPLEKRESNYEQFVEFIRAEGSRAPGLGVLAVGIDSNLKDIHPKVIKRICIGPVCSGEFSREPADLSRLLAEYGEYEDFILLFEDEIIFSSAQKMSKSVFTFGQLRETFYIPEANLELYRRKVSKVHKYMLVPHTVIQHMDLNGEFAAYRNHEIITYGRKSGVHGG